MSLVQGVKNGIQRVKNVGNKIKSIITTIRNAIQFILTPVGQFFGILALVVIIVVLLYVVIKLVENTIGIFFNDEYAGIATTEDYETIVGALGYTGYDSFISEELWQEYAAFEYAVLMDVAEHMYTYQDYVTELEHDELGKYTTSAVFPEGIVKSQYDAGAISKSKWQEYVILGQQDNAPETIPNTEEKEYIGGNREVTTPRLIYEVADHEYEEDALSLMPYIVVVREDLELNYFIEGLSKEVWDSYEDRNLKKIEVDDLKDAQGNLKPVRFSAELNRYNTNMPVSGYKKDLEIDQEMELVVGVEDKEGFVDADREEGYGDDIYYIEQETDIVYKIPLKLLINRYLPKSTLLTAWYMVKRDDPDSGFEIQELMDDIMGIYNAACYTTSGAAVEEIITTGKRDSETGEITTEGSGIKLRTVSEEDFKDEMIQNAVQFDEDGKIIRDASGDAILGTQKVTYATTHKRTFIYFEQFGLENSRYEPYVAYRGPSGDVEPYLPDEARPEAISPSATYLTRDRVNFVKQLNLTLEDIVYKKWSGDVLVEVGPIDLPVNLKPTYILDSGLDDTDNGELIDEKLKSLYNYGSDAGVSINQEAPYAFMQVVRRIFEDEKVENDPVSKPSGDDEYIYDHWFSNQYYLIAEIGNTDIIEELEASGGELAYSTKDIEYRLPEDYRYYNQDDLMPHWYDFVGVNSTVVDSVVKQKQQHVEDMYLEAFRTGYDERRDSYDEIIKQMLLAEIPDAVEIVSYGKGVDYTNPGNSAILYSGDEHVKGADAIDVRNNTSYQINYYWEGVYTIEEKQLQMRQNIHHRRMPALLVKYCDTWAKTVEYENEIIQNQLDYRNYKYLIPQAKTSLGLHSMKLIENPKYRVSTYEEYFNKKDDAGETAVKEADVLDMLVQWEEYGNNGNEVSYAYMRDLYKLTLFIKKNGQMYESAYSYLYIPSTISNFDDGTTQKIFWLERLGVSRGEDELNEDEQNVTRTKANEVFWQNLEYDEYYECIVDTSEGEDARVYAMFPFGAPIIRTYYMLNDIDDKNIIPNGFSSGDHPATDIYARKFIKQIINSIDPVNIGNDSIEKSIYFYELNRLTISHMRNGNLKEDAFILAEKELNDYLDEQALYSPIVSIAPGYVQEVDYNGRSGFYVVIVHDYKLEDEESDTATAPQITTRYDHLKRWPLVEVGDYVGAGTVLGYEGTTGRSSGNHLHFEIKIGGEKQDPHEYIAPVFTPFYYPEKAEEVIDENTELALGSEYYELERTILLEDALFNENNVINGMTLENGEVINYNGRVNTNGIYSSGDPYKGGATGPKYTNLIWGNNVPYKYMVEDVSEIMDLNLLNQTIEYKPEDCDAGGGANNTSNQVVTADPKYFDENSDVVTERLEWPKYFAVSMAEYKSTLVIPYYNGPRNTSDAITEEGREDLKLIQDSLKRAGYYSRAGVKFEEAGYGRYSEEFAKVVKTMQNDLIAKGYGKYKVSSTGELDVNTINAYNTMLQYTSEKNQIAMAEKTTYNSSVDLSIEPALIWAIVTHEGDYGGNADDLRYLALKESDTPVDDSITLEYKYYSTKDSKYKSYDKDFNREQGLMQIAPKLAIERYEEDKVEQEDAVLFIRAPMRNTNIGMELFKEYAVELYAEYSGDIEKEKNKIVFENGGSSYWRQIYEECQEYDDRWIDPENIDRLMVYAIALEVFDKKDIEAVDVKSIIEGEPTEYGEAVLTLFKDFVLKEKE